MKSYRPPRLLTEADLVSTPRIRKLEQQQQNYRYNAQQQTKPLKILNPQSKQYNQMTSTKSASLPHLSTRFLLQPLNRNIMKTVLKDSYSQQIQQAREKKISQKQRNITEEKANLFRFQTVSIQQLEHQRKAREEYKNELLSQIKSKKQTIDHAKTEETSLQKLYQQPRSNNLNHKSQSYKQFYQDAKKYQQQVERDYLNYMQQEEKHLQARHKEKITDYSPNYQLMVKLHRESDHLQQQQRSELRKVLEQQLEMKHQERVKALEMSRSKISHQEAYNPIVNPINFKIDIGNKYILRQLMQKSQTNPNPIQ